MRLLAHIAAFAIIIAGGWLLLSHGYPSFLRQTRSETAAQVMTMCSLAFVVLSVIWLVRKLP